MDTSLIDYLKNPDSYPHQPEQVEHIQSHISHVFMAGALVYKVKKPVNFEFLDFSTLEKRKFYCKREVELNRRLCEGIYLGVVTISSDDEGYQLESDGKGKVVEYAVKMNKLPPQYFLHSLIAGGQLRLKHLDRIADKLAEFYRGQKGNDDILKWGRIEKIRYNTDENFQQTRPFIGETINENSFDAIQQYTNQYFKRYESLFTRRIEEKCIVDGHGDLHLEHIHLSPDKVRIFDCIEFNDRFRYGDVAEDLAYLAMDLDFNDCQKEERYFVEEMARKLSDENLTTHINFYKCYRAYIKGKVKSLQRSEEEVSEEDREKARHTAKNYFNLSLRYALLGSEPVVLVFMGRIAAGKSTLAKRVSEALSIKRASSDRVRKTLMDLPLEERPDPSTREELYSRVMSQKTYHQLFEETKHRLDSQESVIIDATFGRKKYREKIIQIAKNRNVNCFFIEARAPDDTVIERLKSREVRSRVISDARIEDFTALSRAYHPPEELGSTQLIEINTEPPLESSIKQIYEKLIERHLEAQ